MNLYVFNKKFELVEVIDTYTSVIWTNRYYSYGDFELYLPVTQKAINALKRDYYMVREEKEDNAMIIDAIKISTDEETGNFLIVTGKCLKNILYRRIIWNQTNLNGSLGKCIEQLINENAICAKDSKRNFENLAIKRMIQTDAAIEAQYCGENLGEVISSLCEQYGVGWDIRLDSEEKRFYFELYSGINRSCQRKKNNWIIFSDEYENLLKTEYTYSKENYKNTALIAGEGEGTERKYTEIGMAKGIDRYEIFVDAGDVNSDNGISEEEYKAQLRQKGEETLLENKEIESFEGEVIDYQFAFGKDYFLGDIVEIENDYGMQAVSRITEVIESVDESGVYTIPTFSTWEGLCITESDEKGDTITFIPPTKEPEKPKYVKMTFTGIEFNQAVKTVSRGMNTGTISYEDMYCEVKSITFTDVPPKENDCKRELKDNMIENDYVLTIYTSEDDRENVKIYTNADIVILPQNCSYMFYYLGHINNLDLTRFDTSNATDMKYMFAYCGSSVNMKNAFFNLGTRFDTTNVTDMTRMFTGFMSDDNNIHFLSDFDKNAAGELNLGDKFDTKNVKKMDYMFSGCACKKFFLGSKFVISNEAAENNIEHIFGNFRNYDLGVLPVRKTITIHALQSVIEILSNIKYYDYTVLGCTYIVID